MSAINLSNKQQPAGDRKRDDLFRPEVGGKLVLVRGETEKHQGSRLIGHNSSFLIKNILDLSTTDGPKQKEANKIGPQVGQELLIGGHKAPISWSAGQVHLVDLRLKQRQSETAFGQFNHSCLKPTLVATTIRNEPIAIRPDQFADRQLASSAIGQGTCSSSDKSMDERRRTRTMFSDWQLANLEWRFSKNKYLTTGDRIRTAKLLRLNQLQVKTWFQNRRMKWKKQILATGCQKSPTKPKGRPKRDSIPPIDD